MYEAHVNIPKFLVTNKKLILQLFKSEYQIARLALPAPILDKEKKLT